MSSRILELSVANGGKITLSPLEHLTDREYEVFQLVGESKTSAEIAQSLGISRRTVDTHRATIKRKLNLKGSSDVSRYALNWVRTGEAS